MEDLSYLSLVTKLESPSRMPTLSSRLDSVRLRVANCPGKLGNGTTDRLAAATHSSHHYFGLLRDKFPGLDGIVAGHSHNA